MAFLSSSSGIVIIDSRNNSGRVTLPAASTFVGRSIIFKDAFNSFGKNNITLSTIGLDKFDNGSTLLTVAETNGFVNLVAASNTWYTVGGTKLNTQNVDNILISSINGVAFNNLGGIQTSDLTSTTKGLGSLGYLSSFGILSSSNLTLTYNQPIYTNLQSSFYGQYPNWINTSLIYQNGLWLAGSSNENSTSSIGAIQTSYDGLKWIEQTDQIGHINKIRYIDSKYFACGSSNSYNGGKSLESSPNGSNWTNINLNRSLKINDIAYDGTKYIACGTDIANNSLFAWSNAEVAWSTTSSFVISGSATNPVGLGYPSGKAIAYSNNLWVTVGDPNTGFPSGISSIAISTSPNGSNWSYVSSITNSNNNLGIIKFFGTDIAHNGSMWVASGSIITYENENFRYDPLLASYNGLDWFFPAGIVNSVDKISIGKCVKWDGSQWLVGGTDPAETSKQNIMTSPDGLNWTYQNTDSSNTINAIDNSNSFYIGGGNKFEGISRFQYSSNGTNWNSSIVTAISTYSTIITSQFSTLAINGLPLSYTDDKITSTIKGLGSLGYVSSTQFFTSTIEGLGSLGYLSSLTLESTITGLGSLGYLSSLSLESTITGLGSLGYLSSLNVSSLNVSSINVSNVTINYVDPIYNKVQSSLYDEYPAWKINSLIYQNGLWLAGSSNANATSSIGAIQTSYDGYNWIEQIDGIGHINRIRYIESRYYACGTSTNFNLGRTLQSSIDGSNWHVVSSISSQTLNDIAYSINNSRYIACGTLLNEGRTEPLFAWSNTEMENWSTTSSFVISDTVEDPVGLGYPVGKAIAYHNNLWVMAGECKIPDGLIVPDPISSIGIATSPNGFDWSYIDSFTYTLPGGFTLSTFTGYDISYNGSMWVAAGTVNVVNNSVNIPAYPLITSVDGLNWTLPTSLLPATNVGNLDILGIGNCVKWDGSKWIVGGINAFTANITSSIVTSSNGTNWIYQDTGSSNIIQTIANSNKLYVAGTYVNGRSAFQYSSNGTNWNSTIVSVYSTVITMNENNALLINGSALSYTDININSTITGLGSLGYLSSLTLSTISLSYGVVSIINLYQSTTYIQDNKWSIKTVIYTNNLWLAAGDYNPPEDGIIGSIQTSYDGLNWIQQTSPYNSVNRLRYLDSKYYACSGIDGNTTNITLQTSANGSNWTSLDGMNFTIINDIASNSSKFIACGKGPATGTGITNLTTSINGTTGWSNLALDIFTILNSIAYNTVWVTTGQFATTTQDNTTSTISIMTSSDGTNWSPISSITNSNTNNALTFDFFNGKDVAYNGSMWVAAGGLTMNDGVDNVYYPLLTSVNGLDWGLPDIPTPGTTSINQGNCVKWDGSQWLVGGSNSGGATPYTTSSIITSPDGINWTYKGVESSNVVNSFANSNNFQIAITYGSNDSYFGSLFYYSTSAGWVSSIQGPNQINTFNTIITTQCNALLINGLALSYTDVNINSTIEGLGSLGYLSSVASTIKGLGTLGYVSSFDLSSTIEGLGTLGYVSSFDLTSSIEGLGSLGYVSSVTSSIEGLGTLGYISSFDLTSSIEGLGTLGYVSSFSLVSTTFGVKEYTPATPANWNGSPTTIQSALDRISALLYTLNTNTAIP